MLSFNKRLEVDVKAGGGYWNIWFLNPLQRFYVSRILFQATWYVHYKSDTKMYNAVGEASKVKGTLCYNNHVQATHTQLTLYINIQHTAHSISNQCLSVVQQLLRISTKYIRKNYIATHTAPRSDSII